MFLTGDKVKMKRRAAIYGYGNNYFTYLDEIERHYQVVTVIDNDPKKQNESVVPVTDICPPSEIKHILSNAFGFGGNDSSIILSKTGN